MFSRFHGADGTPKRVDHKRHNEYRVFQQPRLIAPIETSHASVAQFRIETKYVSLWDERGCSSLPKQRSPFVKQSFAATVLGGTGQVGGAAVSQLLATSEC
jgi:hypothetical protein